MKPEETVENALAEMFRMAKAHFGNAVKGYWFYADEACPGCGRPIDLVKIKGQEALSLNAFIYRKATNCPRYFIGSESISTICRER